jgi:hypothetical protein
MKKEKQTDERSIITDLEAEKNITGLFHEKKFTA